MTEPSDVTLDLPGRPAGSWLPAAVLGVVLAVLLVAIGWLVWDRVSSDDDADGSSYDAAVAVARQEAVNFFGLDYEEADSSLDRVLNLATGDFADQYAAKRNDVRKNVVANKVAMTPTIPDEGASVEYVGDDEVWVLVAVTVDTTVGSSKPETTYNRARLKLTREHGDWLVYDFESVG